MMRYLKSPLPTIVAIAASRFSLSRSEAYRSPRREAIGAAGDTHQHSFSRNLVFGRRRRAGAGLSPGRGSGMANADDIHEERLMFAAYDERVKELFKVFAEGLAQGEPERPSPERLRRALRFAKRARNLALQAVQQEKSVEAEAEAAAPAS